MAFYTTRHVFMAINYMYGYILVDVDTLREMILHNFLAGGIEHLSTKYLRYDSRHFSLNLLELIAAWYWYIGKNRLKSIGTHILTSEWSSPLLEINITKTNSTSQFPAFLTPDLAQHQIQIATRSQLYMYKIRTSSPLEIICIPCASLCPLAGSVWTQTRIRG